jgi:acyl-CoA synthetase (AMP-forming)/AMP-acid ligase II
VQDTSDVDESAARHELKSELSAYKIPRRFVALTPSEVPLMSSGKVDMQRLKAVFDA